MGRRYRELCRSRESVVYCLIVYLSSLCILMYIFEIKILKMVALSTVTIALINYCYISPFFSYRRSFLNHLSTPSSKQLRSLSLSLTNTYMHVHIIATALTASDPPAHVSVTPIHRAFAPSHFACMAHYTF